MVAEVMSGMVYGVQGELVTVQADISDGLPVFYTIGYLSSEVKEAKERVRTALKNSGFRLPPRRIAVNLAPADIRKSGTYFDFAIAIGLFIAMGLLPAACAEGIIFLGELSLDGEIFPLQGVLSILKEGIDRGFERCMIPIENMEEASLLNGMQVVGFRNLKEAFAFLSGNYEGETCVVTSDNCEAKSAMTSFEEEMLEEYTDFAEVKGQKMAKRAIEIAVSGYHNLFLDGPPGAGKSMLASCIPGIMPEMTAEEKIDTTMIYSVKGLLKGGFSFMNQRPFRSPSHGITLAGMFGGGKDLKPGEISLAHHGVLFLDEFAEYKRELIEMFRVPLEEHQITQIRNGRSFTFPADFILIAAANPCPCGYYPDRRFCRCSARQIHNYQNKLSGPILDRIDLFVRCEKMTYQTLTGSGSEETSLEIRKRIERVWKIQKERYQGKKGHFNGRMSQKELQNYCNLDGRSHRLMKNAFETFHMTGRSYYRVLKVARTIADLDGEEDISVEHLEEALLFRKVAIEDRERGL